MLTDSLKLKAELRLSHHFLLAHYSRTFEKTKQKKIHMEPEKIKKNLLRLRGVFLNMTLSHHNYQMTVFQTLRGGAAMCSQ